VSSPRQRLVQSFEAAFDPRELHQIGFKEFHRLHLPDTQEIVKLAAAAVKHCCFAEDGSWNNQPRAFLAVLDFAETETSSKVSKVELLHVAGLIQGGTKNLSQIEFWLEQQFKITH